MPKKNIQISENNIKQGTVSAEDKRHKSGGRRASEGNGPSPRYRGGQLMKR